MTDYLENAYPVLAKHLRKLPLADLPTAVAQKSIHTAAGRREISIKYDNLSGDLYGGNKVRKLEYILRRARDKHAESVATFGTVASNHALATTLYAAKLGLACTCFLSHQSKTENAAKALNVHLASSTKIVRFGGNRADRIASLRRHLIGKNAWVIPMGGSSWLGTVGFVNAGIELAQQIAAGLLPLPDRIYVATGTMASAAGLALGLALKELPTRVQAIRVTHESIGNRVAMQRLMHKTATLLHRLDPAIPPDLAARARLDFRDEFFADGYARSNDETESAIRIAREELDLALEATYTGKAMAALLHDLDTPGLTGKSMLFWNTYNSRALSVSSDRPDDTSRLPDEFLRYYD